MINRSKSNDVPDLGFPFASAYDLSTKDKEGETNGDIRRSSSTTSANLLPLPKGNRNKQNLVLSTSFVPTRKSDLLPSSPTSPLQTRRHRSSVTKTILGLKNEMNTLHHELSELKKKKDETEKLRNSTASDIYAGGYSTDHLQKHSIRIKANAQIREIDKNITKLEKQTKDLKDQIELLKKPLSDLDRLKLASTQVSRDDLLTGTDEDLGSNISRIESHKSDDIMKQAEEHSIQKLLSNNDTDDDNPDSSIDDTISMSEQTVNLESATWMVSNYLESFQEPNLSTEFILEKANGLVNLLKSNPDIRNNLVLDAFMPSIQNLLLQNDNLISSAAYRVCRHLVDGKEFIDVLINLRFDIFIVISLSYDNSHQLEREQAFKLLRTFVDFNHGMNKPILQAVISCIEKNDDPLKNMALETLLEMCYVAPELVKECHGIRVLEGILQEYYSFSLASIVLDTILNLMSNHHTRKHFINDFDISVLATVFSDLNPKSSVSIERIQNASVLITKALKNYNGFMLFSMHNFQPLKELLAFFQVSTCAPYLIDIFLDILRIKPLPYKIRNKGVTAFRMQPSEYYRECIPMNQKVALKVMILDRSGFQERLSSLISFDSKGDPQSVLATKARYLLTEYLNLKLNLVDSVFTPVQDLSQQNEKSQIFEETFEFAKITNKMSRHRNTIGMSSLNYIDNLKDFIKHDKENTLVREVDDLRFRRMVYDSKVLQTKDFTSWNWNIIQELFEGPLMNSKHLEELAKSTKFIRRLLVFYRPLRLRFSNVDKGAKYAQKYIHVGCLFFKMLTSTSEGLKLLMDDTKIIPQLASLLFRALEGNTVGNIFNESSLKNKIVAGYFKFIGVLTHSKGGIKVLSRWNFFTVIYKMFQFQSRFATKCLLLTLGEIHLQHSAHCRTIMGKALVFEDETIRYNATKHLGERLNEMITSKVTSESELENNLNVQHYKMELLTRQLYDLSPKVVAVADKALYEYILAGNESEESSSITFKLFLNQMVFIRSPILFEILGRPYGFQLLNEINFVKEERMAWLLKKNLEYVDIVEEFLGQTQKAKKANQLEQRDRLPLHFYESLAKTEDGILLLSQTGDFVKFMNIVKRYATGNMNDEDPETIKELKASLWCCGFIGSTELGIGLLDNYSLVDDIIDIAYKSSVTTVRFTAFYTLGSISRTREGCEILDEMGWNCCISVLGKPIGIALPSKIDKFLSYNEEPWEIVRHYEDNILELDVNKGELLVKSKPLVFDLAKLLSEKNALENPLHRDEDDREDTPPPDINESPIKSDGKLSNRSNFDDSNISPKQVGERSGTNISNSVVEGSYTSTMNSVTTSKGRTASIISAIIDEEKPHDEKIDKVLEIVSQLGNHIMSNKAIKIITDMNTKYGSKLFENVTLFLKVTEMMSTFRFKPHVRKFLCGLFVNKHNLAIVIEHDCKLQKFIKGQNNISNLH